MASVFTALLVFYKCLLETIAVFQYVFVFILGPVICIYLTVYLVFTPYWWTLIVYACWFYYDYDTPKRGSRPCEWLKRLSLWRHGADYFPAKLVKTHDLDPNRNYIFGSHPHGVICYGAVTSFVTEALGFSEKFPGITPHACTLTGNFWFPLRREYFTALGIIEVSKESITWQLTRPDKGHAAIIVVGGVAEIFYAHPDCYDLVLADRKGFVKMALKCGADLVPTYTFGENELYDLIQISEDSWIRKAQTIMKKYIGYHISLSYGFLFFLPYKTPVHTVVGKPIRVEQCDDPSEERINELHASYVQGLIDLFEQHKSKYGIPGDRHLIIH